MSEFGRQLADLRKGANLSQVSLAKRAGTDASSISRYESGDRQPDRETVRKVAGALHLNAEATDRLLAAAGLRPDDALSLTEDALVRDLAGFLADDQVPRDRRDRVRLLVQTVLMLAGAEPSAR